MAVGQYKFNNFQEIKSHSSHLYNERLAILFYLLDMDHLTLYRNKDIDGVYKVFSILKQIYNNVRMILRFNPMARTHLGLETKLEGVYTTDIAFDNIDQMLIYAETNGVTPRRIYILMKELDSLETVIKDIMQYFMYFIRPDFKQKPDIDVATEKYKLIADKKSIEELKEIAGKNNKIDFAALGSDEIEYETEDEVEYDPNTDGPLEDYSDNDSDLELMKEDDKEDTEREEKEEQEDDDLDLNYADINQPEGRWNDDEDESIDDSYFNSEDTGSDLKESYYD